METQDKWHVRKGDNVYVISGKDKGKTGEILSVDRHRNRVLVRGVNVVTTHQKPSMASEGGLVKKELSIHVSNVMHIDPETQKPTRVGFKFLDNGKKARYAKKSGALIDKV